MSRLNKSLSLTLPLMVRTFCNIAQGSFVMNPHSYQASRDPRPTCLISDASSVVYLDVPVVS